MANKEFQDRLARLEAKHGRPQQPTVPPQAPARGSGGAGGSGGGGGGRQTGLVFALLAVVALPVAAFMGTMVYQQNASSFQSAADAVRGMVIANGPTRDAARQSARSDVDGVTIRLNAGTMSQAEGQFWASEAGQRQLANSIATSINLDGLKEAARKTLESR